MYELCTKSPPSTRLCNFVGGCIQPQHWYNLLSKRNRKIQNAKQTAAKQSIEALETRKKRSKPYIGFSWSCSKVLKALRALRLPSREALLCGSTCWVFIHSFFIRGQFPVAVLTFPRVPHFTQAGFNVSWKIFKNKNGWCQYNFDFAVIFDCSSCNVVPVQPVTALAFASVVTSKLQVEGLLCGSQASRPSRLAASPYTAATSTTTFTPTVLCFLSICLRTKHRT